MRGFQPWRGPDPDGRPPPWRLVLRILAVLLAVVVALRLLPIIRRVAAILFRVAAEIFAALKGAPVAFVAVLVLTTAAIVLAWRRRKNRRG